MSDTVELKGRSDGIAVRRKLLQHIATHGMYSDCDGLPIIKLYISGNPPRAQLAEAVGLGVRQLHRALESLFADGVLSQYKLSKRWIVVSGEHLQEFLDGQRKREYRAHYLSRVREEKQRLHESGFKIWDTVQEKEDWIVKIDAEITELSQ
ncbi:MAG: hypothetical protein OXG94_12270 [Bacteroidetes bacterium]|nr:hypothetical protein [Bacteroidota bacterium]